MSWFEVCEGTHIEQGDVILACPRMAVTGAHVWPPPQGAQLEVEMDEVGAIVMTQSCDLANDKVEEVLLAQVMAWSVACGEEIRLGNALAASRRFREALVRGNVPGLSILHSFDGPPRLPWAVANFHHLFTLPKKLLHSIVSACGPRLRLVSPYREHLSQAFARFFMRVGLPHDAGAFVTEGAIGPRVTAE